MNIETEIRKALDAKAYEVEVPSGLADTTLAAASTVPVRRGLVAWLRAWRESRRMALPATGYPRWMLAPAAACAALLMFGLGSFVLREDGPVEIAQGPELYSEEPAEPDVEAGGALSSGDASVDRANTSEDADAESGDQEFFAFSMPKLVRSADIRVAVSNFEDAWEDANDIATKHDGAVIDSKTKVVAEEIAEGTVRMRVPSAKLDDVLADLRDLGTLAQLETSGDDIAPQITSVEKEVADAKADMKEYEAMAERPTTVSERITIQSQIKETRERIKALESQKRKLDTEVATSIVNATIFQDEVAAAAGETLLGKGLRTAGRVFLVIASGVLVLAAALTPIALIALAIWFVLRRTKGRRAS